MNAQDIIQYLVEERGWSKDDAENREFSLLNLYELDKEAESWFKQLHNEV